jgi:hypothetical protein
MQNTSFALRFILITRQILMILGFVLFVTLSSWSFHHMQDHSATYGIDQPQASVKPVSLLPH